MLNSFIQANLKNMRKSLEHLQVVRARLAEPNTSMEKNLTPNSCIYYRRQLPQTQRQKLDLSTPSSTAIDGRNESFPYPVLGFKPNQLPVKCYKMDHRGRSNGV